MLHQDYLNQEGSKFDFYYYQKGHLGRISFPIFLFQSSLVLIASFSLKFAVQVHLWVFWLSLDEQDSPFSCHFLLIQIYRRKSLFIHSAFKDFEQTFLQSTKDDVIAITTEVKYAIIVAMELLMVNSDIAILQSGFLGTHLGILPLLGASFEQVKGRLGMAIIMDT